MADRVNQLRDYEEDYRRKLTGFLQGQIEQLNQEKIDLHSHLDLDAMYGLGAPQVSTPRLDALVEESRRSFN